MHRLLASLLLLLAFALPASAQRTLTHPEKVVVKPVTPDRGDDSLVVFGGITAGPNGTTVIVNADGTLNASSSIADGTLTFAKWASNGCGTGEIPLYNGTAWVCGSASASFSGFGAGTAGAPSVYATGDTDTGLYWPAANQLGFSTNGAERLRLDATGRLGMGTTSPAQLLHLYAPTSQVGLRIERGDASDWDILGSTDLSISSGSASFTFTPTGRLGVNQPTPTRALDVVGDVGLTGNLYIGSYLGSSLLPLSSSVYNIGDPSRMWGNAWISQLNALVFAESTVQLFGGYSIVGKNAGTTGAAVASAATQINLGKTIGTTPQWILIKGHDTAGAAKTEYLQVTSLASGTTYNVTRDVTSLNATDPAWASGTPYLVLGVNGDGRVEMFASSGIPRVAISLQGASAAASTDIVRLGGLDAMPGMGALPGKYGLYLGDNTTADFLTYYDGSLTIGGAIRADAGYLGGSNVVTIGTSGLDVGTGRIQGGATSFTAGTGFWFGQDSSWYKARIGNPSGNRLEFSEQTGVLTIIGNGSGITSIHGGNIQTNTVTATQIDANAVTASELAAGAVTAGKISVSSLSAISANLGTITAGTLNAVTINAPTIQSTGKWSLTDAGGLVFDDTSSDTDYTRMLRWASGSFVRGTGSGLYMKTGLAFDGGHAAIDMVGAPSVGGEITFSSFDGSFSSSASFQTNSSGGSTLLVGNILPWNGAVNTDGVAVIGTASTRFSNIHLNLPNNTSPAYLVVNSPTEASALGYFSGLSTTKTVRNSAGSGTCTLIFTIGLLTGGSC